MLHGEVRPPPPSNYLGAETARSVPPITGPEFLVAAAEISRYMHANRSQFLSLSSTTAAVDRVRPGWPAPETRKESR